MCGHRKHVFGRACCIVAAAFCIAALSLPASVPQGVAANDSPYQPNPAALPDPPVRHENLAAPHT